MTDVIIEAMSRPEHKRLLQFIRHTLEADAVRPRQGRSTLETSHHRVDVERLFAAVELLVDRDDQAWSAFVEAWDPRLESFGVASPTSADALADFDRALDDRLSSKHKGAPPPLADALERAVEDIVRRSQTSVREVLADVRDQMLMSLCRILHIEDVSKLDYLDPLMNLLDKRRHVTIATLNYDRAIELACAACGREPPLIKLHGSIDWIAHRVAEPGKLPRTEVYLLPEHEISTNTRPALVFGEGAKLQAEGPYLELWNAWSSEIDLVENLLIVGYSFRDAHVNETIARWFNEHPQRAIVLVSPSNLEDLSHGNSFVRQLDGLGRAAGDGASAHPRRFWHVQGTARLALEPAVDLVNSPLVPEPS